MGKYEPLTNFLRRQTRDEVRLSFSEIERIIGQKLPARSARNRAWWSNNSSNSVLTKAWIAAGFKSEQVDVEGRKLVFRRMSPKPAAREREDHVELEGRPDASKPHPLIGWMKGTVQIAPDADLTEPADPEWGDRAWGDGK